MSRSRPNTRTKSPVKHYFEWSGSEGKLYFYDKAKKQNVYFPNMKFVVLDELHTVSGFSKDNNTGIRGTEVRDINTPITVWIGKKKHTTATYSELKNSVNGLKYTKSVYIGLVKKDGSLEMAKLTLKGAAFSSWINFLKGAEDYVKNDAVDPFADNVGIEIIGKSKQKKNGATKYYEPKFATFEMDEDQGALATTLDDELQTYFDNTLSKNDDNANPSVIDNDDEKDQDTEQEEEETDEDQKAPDSKTVDDLPF